MSRHHLVRARAVAIFSVALMMTLSNVFPASANHGATHISGTVGEIVDPEATLGGRFLRYVGDPAPEGHSHAYQWGSPHIETQPEDGPVTFEGSLDLTDRVRNNNVAMIGLLDKAGLEAGGTEFQRGAYIYINSRPDGSVRIGVSDGNAGGELVQTFVVVSAAIADAGPLDVVFTVDGTVSPLTCAVPLGSGVDGDGCMTLEIEGFSPISDSYGTITGLGGPDEFASGAIPGWEAFPTGTTGVAYDFVISPAEADPQNKEQCKNGGWEDYGFDNQGQCIRYVETGKDSRDGE